MKFKVINTLAMALCISGSLFAQAPTLSFTFPNTDEGNTGEVEMNTNDTIVVSITMTGFNAPAYFNFFSHSFTDFPGKTANTQYCDIESVFKLENTDGFTLQPNVAQDVKIIFNPRSFTFQRNDGETEECAFFSPEKGCEQFIVIPNCTEFTSDGLGTFRDVMTFYTNASGTATFSDFAVSGIGVNALGINKSKLTSNFNVYPNPVSDKNLNLEISGNWIISNVNGEVLASGFGNTASVEGLNKGMYFIKITNDRGVYSSAFVKQ